ncbi:hypothetical protein HT746_14840 [Burkholderia pyrrocinia]|uniref:hypothetical protein n=1 Tax=Burkholderia pyrrocinia TaxID=60550 RepID=UPI0015754759|nr:hypothetical protein [Burkholderia pyrrocinia]NTX28397.1 hypothetical protein [Burkholderia pyrrocinia]
MGRSLGWHVKQNGAPGLPAPPDAAWGLPGRDAPVSGRAALRDSGARDNVRQDRANVRATAYDSAAARAPGRVLPYATIITKLGRMPACGSLKIADIIG